MEKARRIERSGSAKALGLFYDVSKVRPTRTRKMPYFPRVGLVVDFAGYEFTLKFAPLMEAIMSLPERGFSAQVLSQITKEQFGEIAFHPQEKQAVINTSAESRS